MLINSFNQNSVYLTKDNSKQEHHYLIHFDHHLNDQMEVLKTNHLCFTLLLLLFLLLMMIIDQVKISFIRSFKFKLWSLMNIKRSIHV